MNNDVAITKHMTGRKKRCLKRGQNADSVQTSGIKTFAMANN